MPVFTWMLTLLHFIADVFVSFFCVPQDKSRVQYHDIVGLGKQQNIAKGRSPICMLIGDIELAKPF